MPKPGNNRDYHQAVARVSQIRLDISAFAQELGGRTYRTQADYNRKGNLTGQLNQARVELIDPIDQELLDRKIDRSKTWLDQLVPPKTPQRTRL